MEMSVNKNNFFDKTKIISPNINSKEEYNNPDKKPLDKQIDDYIAERYGEDTNHRGGLVQWIKWIIPIWLILVLMILNFYWVSDGVKTTLLVTTTANVLGLAFIVLKGLFK